MTFRIGENETEIDFVQKKVHGRCIQNVKVIAGEFQHASVIAEIGKKIRKVVRKTCAKRRKISLQKDVKIRKQFQEK